MRPFSSLEMDLIMTSYSSSPFLSMTSNFSPKSLKILAKGPTTSAQMNFLPVFLQNASKKLASANVPSVRITTSKEEKFQTADVKIDSSKGNGSDFANLQRT